MKKLKFPVQIHEEDGMNPAWLLSDGERYYFQEYAEEGQQELDDEKAEVSRKS